MTIAGKEARLGNYLIDHFCIISIVVLHAFILDGVFHVIPEDGSDLLAIYFFVLYFGYFFLFEFFLGKTPGKYLTKTVVANNIGMKPTAKQLVFRNLCRLIPFDNFSFLFGSGMHDAISKTVVIKNKPLT